MSIYPTDRRAASPSRVALIAFALLAMPGAAIANTAATQVQSQERAAIEQRNKPIIEAAFENGEEAPTSSRSSSLPTSSGRSMAPDRSPAPIATSKTSLNRPRVP